MNKAELVEALAQHYDGSRAEAARALNAVVQTITRSTAAGEKVAITGFGVFEKVERPPRMVRNPRTGERKEAPATAVPRFRAGTELKAYVSGERALPEAEPAAATPAAPRPARTHRPAPAPEPAAAQEPLVATPEPTPPPAGKKSGKTETKKTDAKKSVKKPEVKKSDPKKSGSKKSGSKTADAAKSGSKKSDAKKSGKKSGKK